MSTQDIQPNKFSELRSIFKYHIDSYNALYQLKTKNKDELNSIYKLIKTNLIDSKKYLPQNIIKDIFDIIQYNNRYSKSYLTLIKLIYDDYQVKEVNNIDVVSNYLFYKEYGIILNNDFERNISENLEILSASEIYRAIMDNDLENFIVITERDGFDKDQKIEDYDVAYSLLEFCCYHSAVDCFKFLRTKFNSEITETCLELSFLGGNPDIMSECLKYQIPFQGCMKNAIISHNIDFVTFLMNEHKLEIYPTECGEYNNLEAFLVFFDQKNNSNECFINSARFNIPSLCEYFLLHGANINYLDDERTNALHHAVYYNCYETVEFLISLGVSINEKDKDGRTALHLAAYFNSKETMELLISHGANINEKDKDGRTSLHYAAHNKHKEASELLISHGANINEKDKDGRTVLYYATINNSKETIELLISHSANINEKDKDGRTVLYYATINNSKETIELLISHSE
ncbi:hypothetical protein TVAG_053260 [Trichomonas vaginalis G3]|uniref:DUF3447 domain-containing protein n=1 Tax=Trichomonas vaginalis (strain ATCC PRA-98 / G3) TaxID=412133 RepID=A2EMS9_TRIV3|nr:proteasome regulatory particle assembly [Trichomonas vaginalis G3]EAY06002.1 hypothetical protein TVAG_053260 [Trichomonas vaginalis G3]KAI5512791.1 proteasome regulatory particle assembly [Trichomonas vaginalis G3]|eukprot:XP_001318225.1 hypothetical protein [Trichomonas vaginalis G3]